MKLRYFGVIAGVALISVPSFANIASTEYVQQVANTKQDSLPTGTAGQVLTKTAGGLEWANAPAPILYSGTGTNTDGAMTQAAVKTELDAITSALGSKANSATTLLGYGITDAYTKSEVDTALGAKVENTALNTGGLAIGLNNVPTSVLSELEMSEEELATTVTGELSMAVGPGNNVSGGMNIALGIVNTVAGDGQTAVGIGNKINDGIEGASAVVGVENTLNDAGYVFGVGNSVNAAGIAFGFGNEINANEGIAVGFNSKIATGAEGAIQLGAGENTSANTFQVFDHQLLDANGTVPYQRFVPGEVPSDCKASDGQKCALVITWSSAQNKFIQNWEVVSK